MTYRQLYLQAKAALSAAGIDSPSQDAAALAAHFFGLSRPQLTLHGEASPSPRQEEAFLSGVWQRAARRPLQYILGQWNFMSLSLFVGEGVLVPREDTGVLVEAVASCFPGASPVGVDLCAGTGAVGLGICSLVPNAHVTCVELSPAAIPYLEKNMAKYPAFHVKAVENDALSPQTAALFPPASLDFIASNPPYIAASQLPSLQAEVQKEPSLALDGGSDGLRFYRQLPSIWLPSLKPGGLLAVEIGETQGEAVSSIFASFGLQRISVLQDWAGLDRCVTGFLPK